MKSVRNAWNKHVGRAAPAGEARAVAGQPAGPAPRPHAPAPPQPVAPRLPHRPGTEPPPPTPLWGLPRHLQPGAQRFSPRDEVAVPVPLPLAPHLQACAPPAANGAAAARPRCARKLTYGP